ncbi:hypothetical protein BDB00DRAFT_797639 [Zychaea mexicana]|uniref:uncharacterized protein n=1 Tax=Zychaea mexicana TaxID=64656 RepID=UPI0022FE7455|nr:uncharacterized protein BDB00DRAFT_797639 [Zychaea mexicana]KAI9498983.1 hypothetical protein BDB00DRAFT_797639 [Zychaea mexicana]
MALSLLFAATSGSLYCYKQYLFIRKHTSLMYPRCTDTDMHQKIMAERTGTCREYILCTVDVTSRNNRISE